MSNTTNKLITGIHHITAIAGNPQSNVDFYTQTLGLRMVKKTINFDAPDVYHFYFGDANGNPGTVFTTFPFDGARRGIKGTGELTYTAFSIPEKSLSFWIDRLTEFRIPVSTPLKRFGEQVIRFEDHDGMGLELVANDRDSRPGWDNGEIPKEFSIKGFYGGTLLLNDHRMTAELLTKYMDYQFIAQEGHRYRYGTEGLPGDILDIMEDPQGRRGSQNAGTVHHIAFRTPDMESQLEVQHKLMQLGLGVTEVKDRNYFKSIYFREPGGVLFEVATDGPGFAIDEEEAHLGESLKLPEWAEPKRSSIENKLPEIVLKTKRNA